MSLINDALKRAKEAQKQGPVAASSNLEFRPIEPAQQRARQGLGLFVLAGLAVMALLVVFLLWQWAQGRPATGSLKASARTAPAPSPAAATAPEPVAPAVAAQPAEVPQTDAPAPPATALAEPVATNSSPADSPVANALENAATNGAAAVAAAPPKPAPLRLQGIFFNPRRPSAVIGGKTVYVGDKVGELRVTAIDQDSATLVGPGQTKVLTLAE